MASYLTSSIMSDFSANDHERFPELFNDKPSVDRRKSKRVVPMKVLVLGLMRTGTASMRAALQKLGFDDVYHMMSVMHDPDDSQMWMQALDAKYNNKGTFTKEEWDQLLGNCQAVCDLPAALFVTELTTAYPSAKVVLTNRDVDAWYNSCSNTIFARRSQSTLTKLISNLDYYGQGQIRQMLRMLFPLLFGPRGGEEENAKRVFREHYDNVRKVVPKENLLEYNIKDGWGPLCEFLGVPVPTIINADEKEVDVPFPHINESQSFGDRFGVWQKRSIQRVVQRYGPFVGLAVLGAGAWTVASLWRR